MIYIHRHPLDVFVSQLNHLSNNGSKRGTNTPKYLGFKFDSVDSLTAKQLELLFGIFLKYGTLGSDNAYGTVFFSFANFYKLSLMKDHTPSVHMLKYEGLIDDFESTIIGVANFLNLTSVDAQLVFQQADEQTKQDGRFFWKRQKLNYKNHLTQKQIDAFNLKHSESLSNMGYVNTLVGQNVSALRRYNAISSIKVSTFLVKAKIRRKLAMASSKKENPSEQDTL